MCVDNVMSPEINLIKNDEFYLFYEMMIQSLKTDNVKEGLNKSLYMFRKHLNSGNIALFRKNEDGIYVFKMSDSQMDDLVKAVGCIVNKTKPLTESRQILDMNLDLSERLKNMKLIHISINEDKDECILAILNCDKEKTFEPYFWDRTKDTMQIILKRAASYERNVAAITTDLLTGLDNRNSYENAISKFNESDADLVFGIFDLFRLKHINDNYTHVKGDEYIKKAANILNKYWPKNKVRVNLDGTEELEETGHCVYRVGGDEFVLLTTSEQLNLVDIKSKLAKEESNMIDLGLDEDVPIGLNSGAVKHNPGDYIKQTFMRADEIMQEDKAAMYKRLKLDRRH